MAEEKPLRPLYLLGGDDRPKVLRAVRRLADRVERDGGSIERYDVEEHGTGPAEAAGACNALGLFSSQRLVLVEGVESWKADAIKAGLEPYAADPTPETVLALVAGPGLRKDHRLRKTVPGDGHLFFELPTGAKLVSYVNEQARRLGVTLEPDATRRLVALVGPRPEQIEAELEKLAAWSGSETVDARAVDELVFAFDERDAPPWDLLDALAQRDRELVFRELERLYDVGRPPASLIPLLGSHVELLRRARAGLDRRDSARAVAAATGLHEYRVQKAMGHARNWAPRDTARAAAILAEADHDAKGGSRLGAEHVLERALSAIL
jgi:DNA polymerase III delta subunit